MYSLDEQMECLLNSFYKGDTELFLERLETHIYTDHPKEEQVKWIKRRQRKDKLEKIKSKL
jgi:hypothetical protein